MPLPLAHFFSSLAIFYLHCVHMRSRGKTVPSCLCVCRQKNIDRCLYLIQVQVVLFAIILTTSYYQFLGSTPLKPHVKVTRAKTNILNPNKLNTPKMNVRIFHKQTSQYNCCRPTIVDHCPTVVDKCFLAPKALNTAFIPSKILPQVWSRSTRLLEWKCFGLLLASDAIMHAACTGHMNPRVLYLGGRKEGKERTDLHYASIHYSSPYTSPPFLYPSPLLPLLV